jgi:glyoxylase-like metal-dependent hydrolase (beta-lactamase superfamily II)
MTVHHLSCGTMCPIGALLVNGQGGVLDPAKLVCHCLLIESKDGLILVDTGFGIGDVENPADQLGRLPSSLFRIEQDITRTAIRQLSALGFDPRDVRHIVTTHLDFDHAGGLPDFPWANVHVLDIEHQVATNPVTLTEKNRYAQSHFAHGPKWALHTLVRGERWNGFEFVQPVPGIEPDILMVPLFGHSRGHCGVAVLDAEGWMLHAGDAIFHHGELDPVEPDAPIGIRMIEHLMKDDWEAFEANQALLRQMVHEQEGRVRIICSHDPAMLDGIAPTVKAGAFIS